MYMHLKHIVQGCSYVLILQLNPSIAWFALRLFVFFLHTSFSFKTVLPYLTNLYQVNKEIVKIQRVTAPVGQMQLKSLIEAHVVSAL